MEPAGSSVRWAGQAQVYPIPSPGRQVWEQVEAWQGAELARSTAWSQSDGDCRWGQTARERGVTPGSLHTLSVSVPDTAVPEDGAEVLPGELVAGEDGGGDGVGPVQPVLPHRQGERLGGNSLQSSILIHL